LTGPQARSLPVTYELPPAHQRRGDPRGSTVDSLATDARDRSWPRFRQRIQEQHVTDEPIVDRINRLAHEEEQLWQRAGEGGGIGTADKERLDEIGVELDQCYDLLRQRQARREFGQDPNEAELRPPEIVERYQQ
jgi:hypothetical protein